MQSQLATAERRLEAADRRARRADVEERVHRIAAEIELDEAAEIERLSRLPSADLDGEIALMKSRYRRRPDRFTPPEEDTVVGDPKGARIWGEAVARMSLNLEDAGAPLQSGRSGSRSNSARRRDALRLAITATKRFAASRSEVTRA